jgi:hypothetical protein
MPHGRIEESGNERDGLEKDIGIGTSMRILFIYKIDVPK